MKVGDFFYLKTNNVDSAFSMHNVQYIKVKITMIESDLITLLSPKYSFTQKARLYNIKNDLIKSNLLLDLMFELM